MSATKIERLREITLGGGGRVDRENGVIHGVRVLGPTSRNGRRYLPEAIRGAVGLYEGLQVNLDHSPNERSVKDRAGWLQNARVGTAGDLRADFCYFKSDATAAKICEAAERNPAAFGFSHHAEGKTRREGDTVLVEQITRVFSVDVVSAPATSNGLFEQADATPAADAPLSRNEEFAVELQKMLNRTDWGPGELFAAVAELIDKRRKAAEAPAPLPTEPAAPTSESHRGSGAFPSGLAFAEAVTGDSASARPAARPVRRLAEAAHCGPVPSGADFASAICGDGSPGGAIPSGPQFVSEICGGMAGGPDKPADDASEPSDFAKAICGEGDWTPTKEAGVPRGRQFVESII